MLNKIKAILGSIRFWEVVVTVVLSSLVATEVITNDIAVAIAGIIATIFGVSVVIGTVDRAAENIGKK